MHQYYHLCSCVAVCIIPCEFSPPFEGSCDPHVTVSSCALALELCSIHAVCVCCIMNVKFDRLFMNAKFHEISTGIAITLATLVGSSQHYDMMIAQHYLTCHI